MNLFVNLKIGCFSQLNGFQLAFPAFPVFDILTSNNTIPDKFLGNPFYLEALNTLSSITTHEPTSVYDLYSTSIWYNKTLVTKLNLLLKLKKDLIF